MALAPGNTNTPMMQGTPRNFTGLDPMAPNTQVMLPEEKAALKERRRIEAMIKGYYRSPGSKDDAYINQLEQYAAMYGIPFERKSAGVIRNAGAAVGGFLDSFVWDLVPDDWYSSQATAAARKVGKGAGLASAAILSGGTSLLGKGMTSVATSGLGRFTTAGAALGAKKMLAPSVAGYAKSPGMVGDIARTYMQSGQGKNVAAMAVDDIAASAKTLAAQGEKGAALEAIEGGGALLDDAAKIKMAEDTGAVAKGLESQIYQATKGIGAGAEGAKAGSGRVETIIKSLLDKPKGQGVGPKTKKSLEAFLGDKNKVDQLEKLLNDPNIDIDTAVKEIRKILPKSTASKAVKKSEIIQLLGEFYGFSQVGG